MQLELTREGGNLTAALIGELDHHAAAELRQRIDTAVLSCRPRRLIINLERLTFMDSSGIGLIMGRYRLMASLGGEVRLSGTSPRMERMIRLAGLDKLPIWEERKNEHETHQ
ncbi:MAG: anti-sigma factor antagonist [Clostridia bacterium]|nr:anti-sigma factor antagonist [Clostridia bacterium]